MSGKRLDCVTCIEGKKKKKKMKRPFGISLENNLMLINVIIMINVIITLYMCCWH